MLAARLLLLAACATPGADGPADTAADTGDTDTGDTGDTDTGGVAEDNIARVLGDCDGTFRTPDEYPNQLMRGSELQRHFLADPEAVCNDGTPGVIYVRPASDDQLAAVWEIHIQGGGGCGSHADCAERWCGDGYYDASKMSSAYAPEQVGAVGIMDSEAGNLLAGANHVYLYYCSSDGWSGQGVTTQVDEAGVAPPFTMITQGHRIVAAAVEELRAGSVVADGGWAMPDLDEAEVVLLNGTSAGSNGARLHADWLRDQLAANGTAVRAIFDAANDPSVDDLPETYREGAATLYRSLYDDAQSQQDYVSFADTSCVDHWAGTGDEYLCSVDSFVIRNHVTTPFFVRQDLRDTTGLAEALAVPLDTYEALQATTLAALPAAAEAGIEGVTEAPGVYGPNCAQHVALETDAWWRTATLTDGDTTATFQDAVRAWWQGEAVQLIDQPVAGDGDGPGSACAAVDDER